jgi:EAL domain-containing protein (putative c-di-GMP-specific phosphodiesterase class I)
VSRQTKEGVEADLSADLVSALEGGQFSVFYQPQFDAVSSALVGAESFIRWDHPEFGFVPPLEFIPIAEANGLMPSIGMWILRIASEKLKAWQDLPGKQNFKMSMNVSATQLEHGNFPGLVAKQLKTLGIAPESFEIELSEPLQVKPWFVDSLTRLKANGLRISIDDFGTAFSSLSVLKRLSVDMLKIDQSLTAALPSDRQGIAIVKATVAMGKSLGIATIAEGVENSAQAELLKTIGCDYLQGGYFCMPVPAPDFEARFLQTIR